MLPVREKLRWYFACSLVMYSHPDYDKLLEYTATNLQRISPNTINEIIQAKGSYVSGPDWLSKWPGICRNIIDGGLLFILDNVGYVGKGVFTEISDVMTKGLPVFLVDRSGVSIPIPSLQDDFVSYGPSWTLYAHFDVDKLLGISKPSLSIEEVLLPVVELSSEEIAALEERPFEEGEGLTEGDLSELGKHPF
jgi:hypothetical protein